MIYVFDSGPLIWMFRYYYPDRFPTLWEQFDELIASQRIISVKEVSRELDGQDDLLANWINDNKKIFQEPTQNEMIFIGDIFKVPHFQGLIRKQERLQGKPVADPFVIAKAQLIKNSCVITTEKYKKNASQIPNVCKHFNISCMNLEQFMEKENWKF
ncbi:MAG: DUF4411 family protein [Gammaproteobacteria bacterium]|nr:DUF4411 family protein [Gammaproteobacteria bacterium]